MSRVVPRAIALQVQRRAGFMCDFHQPCYSRAMPITEPITDAQQKQLAMQWKRAAPFLAQARRNDIRRQNNAEAIDSLNSLFREAIKRKKRSRTSGFVDMYQILRRSQV